MSHGFEQFEDARPGSPEDFAMQLCLVEDSRDVLMTEEECAEHRASVLDEITSPSSYGHLPGVVAACALGSSAVLGYGYLTGNSDFVLGGLVALTGSAIMVMGAWRSARNNARLTAQDRLAIVASLQSWQLIEENEADALRAKIHQHYHAYRNKS